MDTPNHNHNFDLPYQSKFFTMSLSGGGLTPRTETKYQCSGCYMTEDYFSRGFNAKVRTRVANELKSYQARFPNSDHTKQLLKQQAMINIIDNCKTVLYTGKFKRITSGD
jgi:hypothetical protein